MTAQYSDVPSFDVTRIFRIKRAIERDVNIACYVGTRPEAEDFEYLVRCFQQRLPRAELAAVRRSLLELTGKTITAEMLSAAAWRLAGNLASLRAGEPVMPWTRQRAPEWAPLQVVATRLWITQRGRRGGMFRLRVLAGTACSLTLDKFWSREFCAVAARRMGFTRMRGKYPWQHISQLVGMRFAARLLPERSREEPDFEEMAEARGAILSHNRKLLRARSPRYRVCPENFPTSLPCHLCTVGMTRCDLATHLHTYVRRYCHYCRQEAWQDPGTRDQICLDCQYKRLRERHGQQE